MTPFVQRSDAVTGLRTLADASVDAIVSDPPYAEVDRDYGRLTETQWRDLMDGVIAEARRVLKPRGSAVWILQPNSERLGRMRPWLFRFIADMCESWNVVQDVWWWNASMPPTAHSQRTVGLMRPSVKACVWTGAPECYRDQESVLWAASDAMAAEERAARVRVFLPSGHSVNRAAIFDTVRERGGTTPFNLLPVPNSNSHDSAGSMGHGAGTPYPLAAWWVRYLCPIDGLVVDPFAGSGTMGRAALDQGRRWWGCDSDPRWERPDGLTEPPQPQLFGSRRVA